MRPELDAARLAAVARLRRERPKSALLRGTAAGLGALVATAWLSGQVEVGAVFSRRRLDNLERFVTREALPQPLRDGGGVAELAAWLVELMRAFALEAMLATLALAVVAAMLAGVLGLLLGPLAARNLATRRPFAAADRSGARRGGGGATGGDGDHENGGGGARGGRRWRLLTTAVRALCVVLRAFPEYLVAFFLGAVLSSPAWAAVLALALHNGGILGRLYGDTIENLPPRPFAALRALGASRRQVALLAALPTALPRLLLYFFYRLETCVREATVLGMLGFVSLGYWIREERAAMRYDVMLVLVGLGVVIVLVGDLCSYVARAVVRRAV